VLINEIVPRVILTPIEIPEPIQGKDPELVREDGEPSELEAAKSIAAAEVDLE